MKKISVIIPVYNSEKYIEKCLDSVLNQTYSNYEIIVVNDGSTDNSDKIISKYVKKYKEKIKYINKKNEGVSRTRNKAISKATGDYITFMDNDDWIDKDYFEKLIKYADLNYDVIVSGYKRPNSNGKILRNVYVNDKYDWSKFLVIGPWAKLYRLEYIKKNNINFLENNIGEDIYFNLQAYLLTNKIKCIDYIGYNWFFNEQSVSNSKQKDFKKLNVFKLLNSCKDVLEKNKVIEKNKDLLDFYFYRFVIWFLLFCCKKQKYKDIKNIYNELFNWLEEYFPDYKKSKYIGINKPKGDTKSYQLIYLIFTILHKLHLGKIFVYLFGKI